MALFWLLHKSLARQVLDDAFPSLSSADALGSFLLAVGKYGFLEARKLATTEFRTPKEVEILHLQITQKCRIH